MKNSVEKFQMKTRNISGSPSRNEDAGAQPHWAGSGGYSQQHCQVGLPSRRAEWWTAYIFSGKDSYISQISVISFSSGSEIMRSRRRTSSRTCLRWTFHVWKKSYYWLLLIGIGFWMKRTPFQMLCGTDPFPTDFRAKKYKLDKHSISKVS